MTFKIKLTFFRKLERSIATIKETDVQNELQIPFSGFIYRYDQDLKEEIKGINRNLENLWKGKGIKFINNNDIDVSCLNRSKLHLNKSGTAQLVKKASQTIKPN